MRWTILVLGALAGGTFAQDHLVPVFKQSGVWSCHVETAFSCQKDVGCKTFGQHDDPLVQTENSTIEIAFSQKTLLRPGWRERPIEFDQDGIYTIVRSADTHDTVFMRIENETGNFVEAMTTSDEWTITSFGLCRPTN